MTPLIEGTQTGDHTYEVTVRPPHGRHLTLHVVGGKPWRTRTGYRQPKALVKTSPTSASYITEHRGFEAAVKSANVRARKYLRAYSVPRTLTRQEQSA